MANGGFRLPRPQPQPAAYHPTASKAGVEHQCTVDQLDGGIDVFAKIGECVGSAAEDTGCRRKIEMSLGVQSRDDARVPDGHEERDLDCISAGELSSAFDCRAGSGLSYYVGDR
jgi:hypothetical protein